MGITLAILKAFGYIPVCNIWFIIKVKGMYSSFFRLFTIVLDRPSQPELLLLSKQYVQDFFFCYDFEFHSHIVWGPKIFFVCSMKEVVNINAIGQIFSNSGKKVLKELAMSTG